MRGRWAAGIVPRNFAWIIQDRLAVSERPGGYAPHHRKVRRQEEILWLKTHGFTRVVSLLASGHNLHAYDELGVACSHFPLPAHADVRAELLGLYPELYRWLREGEQLLVHQDELSDRLAGVVAGFLCWAGLLPEPPRAITAVEQLLRRQMGAAGRSIVALAAEIEPPHDRARALAGAARPVPPEAGDGESAARPEEGPDAAPAERPARRGAARGDSGGPARPARPARGGEQAR